MGASTCSAWARVPGAGDSAEIILTFPTKIVGKTGLTGLRPLVRTLRCLMSPPLGLPGSLILAFRSLQRPAVKAETR